MYWIINIAYLRDVDTTYQCEPTSSNWNGSCVHPVPPADEPETSHRCSVRRCWVVPTRFQWFLRPPALLQGYSWVNIWVSMNLDGHVYERGQCRFEVPGSWTQWAQGFFPPAPESELHIDTWYHTSPRPQGCLPCGMKGLCKGCSPCWSAWKWRSIFSAIWLWKNCANLSPFWKSTTDVGMKNPWQHAVAPMPVTSRCGRLEFACSIALYVLHVLGYWTVKRGQSYEHIPLTWAISFPEWRWALYESGLAMNAIPGERGTSTSLVLHLICSAEKLPSIMKVWISWFLWKDSERQSIIFEWWHTKCIIPSNQLED